MTGILYFSSTGNSLYIAQQLQNRCGGEIKYIPRYSGDGSEFDKIVIVSPVYSFGLPVHVYDMIPRLSKSNPVFVILNYGGAIFGADYFTYSYAKENELDIKSVYTVKMPENFTLDFTVPKVFLNSTLKTAPKRVEKVIDAVCADKCLVPKRKKTKTETYLKNKNNWHIIGERFSTAENCTLCGKCVHVCPSGNISLTNGKITFSDKCVACLGCYHRCPQKAIRYKNSKKKYRYINPLISENNIGKDK